MRHVSFGDRCCRSCFYWMGRCLFRPLAHRRNVDHVCISLHRRNVDNVGRLVHVFLIVPEGVRDVGEKILQQFHMLTPRFAHITQSPQTDHVGKERGSKHRGSKEGVERRLRHAALLTCIWSRRVSRPSYLRWRLSTSLKMSWTDARWEKSCATSVSLTLRCNFRLT